MPAMPALPSLPSLPALFSQSVGSPHSCLSQGRDEGCGTDQPFALRDADMVPRWAARSLDVKAYPSWFPSKSYQVVIVITLKLGNLALVSHRGLFICA